MRFSYLEGPMAKRLRTLAAGEYCCLSARTLEKKRLDGTGPVFMKRGKAVIYDTQDLDEWLDAGRRTSTSDPGREAIRGPGKAPPSPDSSDSSGGRRESPRVDSAGEKW